MKTAKDTMLSSGLHVWLDFKFLFQSTEVLELFSNSACLIAVFII